MNEQDIKLMARDAHLDVYGFGRNHESFMWSLKRFAKLVAEHERNEIIQILEDSTGYVQMDLIRERGQA